MNLRNVAVLVLWASCAPIDLVFASEASEPRVGRDSADARRGRDVYRRACASCHGRSGRGDGPAAAALDPKPRDFTAGQYKFRSTPSGMPPTDGDLFRVVTSGIPRTYMFAWNDLLSEPQRHDVVAYIKTFSDVFEADDDSAPIEIPPAPPVGEASVAEGKSLYMIMQCWSCHGSEGRGDGEKAGTLVDSSGREIVAFDFTVGSYKGGSDHESVFRTFDTGLNGTPMPSYAEAFAFASDSVDPSRFTDVYSDDDVAALSTYLRSQPSRADLSGMARDEITRLESRRKWALVHYVESLSRDPGWFHWLFVEDTEVAK